MLDFLGSIVGAVGLIMIMICGGGETMTDCLLCGGIGFSMMALGGTMIDISERRSDVRENEEDG